MSDEYEGGSKFNAGILTTIRVNDVLKEINFAKTHFIAFNLDYQDFNYNVYLDCVDSLFVEISGWLKQDEIKKCDAYGKIIREYMINNPIHEGRTPTNPNKIEMQPDVVVATKVKQLLATYEMYVRKLGIKYSIIAATKDDDDDEL